MSDSLGFAQQITKLTKLPRTVRNQHETDSGVREGAGGGVSHSKHRSAYSQVARCGVKGGPRLGTTGALLRYSHWPLPELAQ